MLSCHTDLMGDFNNPAGKRQEGYDSLLPVTKLQDASYSGQGKRKEFGRLEKAIDGWKANVINFTDSTFLEPRLRGYTQPLHVVLDGQRGPVVSDHFGLEIIARWA